MLTKSTVYIITVACISYLVHTLGAKGNVDSVKGPPLRWSKVLSLCGLIVVVVGIEVFFAFSTGGEIVGIGIGFQMRLEVICIFDFEEEEGFVVLGQTGPMLKTEVSMNFCASKVYSGI